MNKKTVPNDRRSAKLNHDKVRTDLMREAARLFHEHWVSIAESQSRGAKSRAVKYAGSFEAPTRENQLVLGERFYGAKHAKKMASLSEREISKNLSVYLDQAIEFVIKDSALASARLKYIKSLTTSEYVLFEHGQIRGYPANVLYDDWWERIGGLSIEYRGRIAKSTGEAFLADELNWLHESIKQNVTSNLESEAGDEYVWEIFFRRHRFRSYIRLTQLS